MDEEDALDLGCQVLPWISNQAILIGQQTRNKAYGTLGCELFSSRNEADHFQTLSRIRSYKDSTSKIRQTVITETQESLKHFVLRSPEYHAVLRLISDCLTVEESGSLHTEEHQDDCDIGYPGYLNDILYTQLQAHATCGCRTGHLESTQLRLSTDTQNDRDQVSFEFVFKANPFPPTRSLPFVQWRESNVTVPRRSPVQKRKKKVGFISPSRDSLSPKHNDSHLPQRLRRLELGEFCRLIDNRLGSPIQFHIGSDVLKVIEPANPKPSRRIRPSEGLSLGQWLEQIPHLSNKAKSHLAYTVAKSVWQYYNSPWMMTPWTHESIQLLFEEAGLTGQERPHPYLTTRIARAIVKSRDFYDAHDLMHQYPHILALGILLIEIGIKQPLTSDECPPPLSETVVNDYYTRAWTTAQRSNLSDRVHSLYEEAVNNCLNPEPFNAYSIQQGGEAAQIKARQDVLYEKIVLPLKRLSGAYQDDWDIQNAPLAETIGHHVISQKTAITPKSIVQEDFTIAIFCALPLEVDAVSALFDDRYEDFSLYQNAPGDSNTYTLGRMGRHHTALVHLPGMGKSVASQASSSIRSTYPNIKLSMVVGICGGIPYTRGNAEVILGDIVISDGIIQHDFGRRIPGGISTQNIDYGWTWSA
ncbi:hypothetical protein AbraIFM66950_005104 [Aspergillus brasiliensis]|nr:hypothetical protein AbraIFM66950_005104 [Aspergillus brasiliensis]